MLMNIRTALLSLAAIALAQPAWAQFHDAEPKAAAAFEAMVKAYRERPGLTVRTTVTVEVAEGDIEASSSEVKAEFILGPNRSTMAKFRDFVCYLSDGRVTVVHTGNEEQYFSMADEGSPYYVLMAIYMDLPFPHLAIALGEDDMDDLYMQFHPKAPWVRPTSVFSELRDGRDVQVISMTSDFEHIELVLEPESKLLQSLKLDITGGHLVQPGTTMTYTHSFDYDVHEAALPESTFAFDIGEREKVDELRALVPRREGERRAGGAAVGREAPPFVLATLDGGAIDLEDLRGQVVVLDFWATWCGPCVHALPLLHDLDRWARDEMLPVTVITINTFEIPNVNDNTPDARFEQAAAFWERHKFRLPVAMDYTDEVAAEYGVGGIPTTFVIRSDGVVHSQHVGAGRTYVDDLKRDIQQAIAALEAE